MRALVSVIMPVFNGDTYLQSALRSVQQQGEEIQFIVVDDGSTDGTAKTLASHRPPLSIVTQTNQGAPAARNAGLRIASGEYVAFIDADDLWTPGRLTRQLHYLKANPTVDILQERLQHIRFDGTDWIHEGDSFHAMSLSAALFRRDVFEQVGLLDQSMPYCDDVDWFMRAQQRDIAVVRRDGVALLHRRHANNLTNRTERTDHYTLRAILKHKRSAVSDNR